MDTLATYIFANTDFVDPYAYSDIEQKTYTVCNGFDEYDSIYPQKFTNYDDAYDYANYLHYKYNTADIVMW